MHVLLTESSFGDAAFLVQPLREAGCLVSSCPLDEPFAQPDLENRVTVIDVDGLLATCRAATRHLPVRTAG